MAQLRNLVYEFGPYRLDVAERVLWRSSQPVSLTPKSLDILLVLLQNSGHVVEKSFLIEETWPETFVEEGNLSQNIFVLRKVLGEADQGAEYIETIPRRGYRFVAPVKCVNSSPELPLTAQTSQHLVAALPIDSLAVLPFINTDGDSKVQHLADGLTEGIINSLSELSRLRVMSSNAVERYRGQQADAQNIGKQLEVGAVLVGKVQAVGRRVVISVELVDVANGWQLWGESYDAGFRPLLDVQEEIARQISGALRLRLTGAEEQQLTKRYTAHSGAYQAYLKGRYYWAKYTKNSLQRATEFFQEAIALDPNYSLAYAGIVDCYLRLATNYIPPSESPLPPAPEQPALEGTTESQSLPDAIGIRYDWDRKTAERELKRAAELNTNYPGAHQWSVAYAFGRELYETRRNDKTISLPGSESNSQPDGTEFATQFHGVTLTPDEEVQVFCTIAREQIDTGNYEAACAVLERWWELGHWPKLDGLRQNSSADLLFTSGALAGWIASSRKVPNGQKHAQALLSAAIGAFEQLGLKTRAAEARIELGYCYYREGIFDLARNTIAMAVASLPPEEPALRAIGLVRLALVNRHAGRPEDAIVEMKKAGELVEMAGPWVRARYHMEMATVLKDLAIAEMRDEHFDSAVGHFRHALEQFEAIGSHRHTAAAENNYAHMLRSMGHFDEAQALLLRARNVFESLGDRMKRAQVDDTVAQLQLATGDFERARQAALEAVTTLEAAGEDSILAEALRTQGLVFCRLQRFREARLALDRAYQLAKAAGDFAGAARALLITADEICNQLDPSELQELSTYLQEASQHTTQSATRERLQKALDDLRCIQSLET